MTEFHVAGTDGGCLRPGRVRLNTAVQKNPLGTFFDMGYDIPSAT